MKCQDDLPSIVKAIKTRKNQIEISIDQNKTNGVKLTKQSQDLDIINNQIFEFETNNNHLYFNL